MGAGETGAGQSPTVFISYASQDAVTAQAVVEALEQGGLKCWVAPRDVVPGEFYASAIVHAIDAAKVLVLVYSEHTATSQHVLREVERASSRRHSLIAFKVDRAPMPEALEYFFNSSHWLEANDGIASVLPQLVEGVRRALRAGSTQALGASGRAQTPAPAARATTQLGQGTSRSIARRPLLALSALAILGLALLGAWLLSLSGRTTKPLPAQASVAAHAQGAQEREITAKSIAVLPFADMSERHDQEYFGDGMADEIINILGKIPELKVIGRTSSFQFKGKSRDLREMGAALGAAYIVEGSVRRYGDHVRVSAQLIDARTAAQIWSESYDRELGDVLRLQSQIATSLARALQLAVGADDTRTSRALHSTEAYTLYLRGRYAYDGPGDIPEAQSDYEQALALDPNFLRVAEAQAWMYAYAALTQEIPARIAWQHAKESAARALAIDENSAPAHAVLGLMHAEYEYDWAAADAEFARALSLNPRDPMTLDFAARVACDRGRYEEALRHIDAALAVDPLSARAHRRKGFILYFTGDDFGAEREYRRSLEIVPEFNWDHLMISWILVGRGDLRQALIEAQAEAVPGAKDQGLSVVYYALGRHAESDAALTRLTREFAGWPTGIALAHAYRKEPGQAFEWLEKAYSERDADLLLWVRGHPFLQPLRSDPRFKTLMSKVNMPE